MLWSCVSVCVCVCVCVRVCECALARVAFEGREKASLSAFLPHAYSSEARKKRGTHCRQVSEMRQGQRLHLIV